MSLPCENTGLLKDHGSMLKDHGEGIERLDDRTRRMEESQSIVLNEIRDMVKEMRDIVLKDTERRMDIEQLKRDREVLFEKYREARNECDTRSERFSKEVESLKLWRANLEGKLDPKRVDAVHDFVQQEKGIRRFVPALIAAIALVISLSQCSINTHNFINATKAQTLEAKK